MSRKEARKDCEYQEQILLRNKNDVALAGNFILSTGFAVAGERMTRSLRKMAFEAMVSGPRV